MLLLVAIGGYAYWIFAGSLPMLEGRLRLVGLEGQVEIERDSAGVPTIRGGARIDLARALGFLHGQERFFQMDLLRRAGAGELSALVGSRALEIDKLRRRHRFRSRAETILAALPEEQRTLLDAYVAGVNEGVSKLSHPPFEYSLLREAPEPWQAADTLLVVYAMYFDLQDADGWPERRRALLLQALGPALTDFLYPRGNPHEVPIDGVLLPEPPLPDALPPGLTAGAPLVPPPAPVKGSNSFAVAGSLTATGAAIVANDEHLGLRMPNIWYRARLVQTGTDETALDITGTTLPGLPFIVAGSNSHVAWGFTNSYIATGDAVLLDPSPSSPDYYQTPQGPKLLQIVTDRICAAHGACQDFPIEETIWGPVVGRTPDGRRIAWRWLAQDPNAIDFKGELQLERAHSVREALDAAHQLALPDQNFVVGDSAGHIAWSIAGQVPKRIGLEDGVPLSWADGSRGWQGYLAPEDVPEIVDPPNGRLWTANNRIVGGDALALLGDGGYDQGDRARAIRDDLMAKDKFAEADLLAIQLDDRAAALVPWQKLLLAALAAPGATEPRFAAMLPYVRDWGVRAAPDSVGYRLVRGYQSLAVRLLYTAYTAPIAEATEERSLIPNSGFWPAEMLLTERPANLVPPPYKTWDAVTGAVLDQLADAVKDADGGDLARFTWGQRNHTGIRHPLSGAVPLLSRLTDPPDIGMAGDGLMPRVVNPGFGASERFVVSPGHEASAIYEMPGGQAGDPLSSYYLTGHQDWVEGKASAFLPGAKHWSLVLEPG
ncbi:MAG: penicillin acylase family protein [Aliidongia sp.]